MDKKIWIGLGVAAMLVVVVALVRFWPHSPDCAFSGWKNSVGVDLDVTISDLQTVKAKVGLNDEQVREFDTLLKDYAIKYDTACQDFTNKRMNQSEYSCRRRNMDETLDQIRRFVQAVEAAKSIADAKTQREVVLTALKDLHAASQSGYGAGCTSSMVVDPKKMTYADHMARNSLQISNSGNNDFIFSVENLPEAFLAEPKAGSVRRGETVSVIIYRLAFPVPPHRPITFHMRSNFQDDIPVQVEVDTENASLYDDLTINLRKAAGPARKPGVSDALQVIDESLQNSPSPNQDKEGVRYLLAAGLLNQAGSYTEAGTALETASTKYSRLSTEPSTFLFWGIAADGEGNPNEALRYFSKAKNVAPSGDIQTKATSDLFSGAVTYKASKKTAEGWFSEQEVQGHVKANPGWIGFVAREFRDPKLQDALVLTKPPGA